MKWFKNLDYAQTLLEAASIVPPSDMQGESLMPLLTGNKDEWTRGCPIITTMNILPCTW